MHENITKAVKISKWNYNIILEVLWYIRGIFKGWDPSASVRYPW